MADIAFIVLSFLSFILNIAPFFWQVRHGNSGPICLTFWTLVMNLNAFVCLKWNYTGPLLVRLD